MVKSYEYMKCDRGDQHEFYQLNMTCTTENCPYEFQPFCSLCFDQRVKGKHQHETKAIKPILLELADIVSRKQLKQDQAENSWYKDEYKMGRLLSLAKEFKSIGENCLNVSYYLMDIVEGNYGIFGLEKVLTDILGSKSVGELRDSLLKLKRHIKYQGDQIRIREYEINDFEPKLQQKKDKLYIEIQNLIKNLRLEIAQDIKKMKFVKSLNYSKFLEEVQPQVFQGSKKKCEIVYSDQYFNQGKYSFSLKIDRATKFPDHVYVVLMREDGKDKGSQFFSPYHCIFCR